MKENQNDQETVCQCGEFSVNAWLVANSEAALEILSARRGPTGPRTEFGKMRSSQNALKTGILSRATLLKSESRSEYRSLLEDLQDDLQPEGKLEQILVEKLTSILWRYTRLLTAEGAEIRKRSEFREFDRRCSEENEAEEFSMRQEAGPLVEISLEPVGLIWNIQNSDVLERCKELLIELRNEIQTKGLNWDRHSSVLKTIYGDIRRIHLRPMLHQKCWPYYAIANLSEAERQSKGYAAAAQCKAEVLRQITAEITYLKRDHDRRESIESKRREVEILRQCVPDSPGLDRLLRYESSLERAFDRTMTQLERAQRMRKGQPLPPQLNVKVS